MKNRVANFFLSLMPAAFFLLLEYTVTLAGVLVYIFLSMSIGGMEISDTLDELMTLMEDPKITVGIMIIYETFILFAYGFWYRKATDKPQHSILPQNINVISTLSIWLLSFGMVVIIHYVTMVEDLINPAWYDVFEDIMEDAGLADDISVVALLYVCLVAPIVEELIFRGLVFHYAKKAFPVWVAIIYQAALFGLFHMNIYQGIYAFAAGLFLGFVAWYGGNITWTVILHMLLNTTQSLPLFGFLDHVQDNYFYFLVILTGGVLACIAAIFCFVSGIDRKNAENALYEEYLLRGYEMPQVSTDTAE